DAILRRLSDYLCLMNDVMSDVIMVHNLIHVTTVVQSAWDAMHALTRYRRHGHVVEGYTHLGLLQMPPE
ncbi:hypothetical protein L9F63_003497, partial [Diploptera punctata]